MSRLRVAALLFSAAVFFAIRCSWPLRHGYFAPIDQKDDPDWMYVTMAGVGASLSVLFGAGALVLISARFRQYGGFLLVALSAGAASAVPALLDKWGGGSTWADVLQSGFYGGWLGLGVHSEAYGFIVQGLLALTVVAALAAQLWLWSSSGTRLRTRTAPA